MIENHLESVVANSDSIKERIEEKEKVRISLDHFLNNPIFHRKKLNKIKRRLKKKVFE